MNKLKFEYQITLIYLALGLLWIIFSDAILEFFVRDINFLTYLQSIKGSFYVVLTALLLFFLVRRYVTAQQDAEELLHESNERYRAIYEKAPIAFQSLDTEGRFIDVNPAWLDTLGYTFEEVSGKYFVDFLHPESKENFEKRYPKFKKEGKVNVILQLRNKSGNYLYVMFDGNAGYNLEGNFKQSYCTFSDITDDYIAAQQLIISEKRYKSLFYENKSIMLLIDDKTGEIVDANEAAIKFYGYSLEQLKIMKISNINILSEEEISIETNKAKNEKRDYFLFRHKLSNGEIRDVQVYSGKIVLQDKLLTYSITHDITKQVKIAKDLIHAKEKAEESDRLKSAFLANMSHEIRTPMNGILGFIDLLEQHDIDSGLHDKYLGLVKQSSNRLLNTLNDIVEISKIESGQASIIKSTFKLYDTLEYLFDFFKPEAEDKELKFILNLETIPKDLEINTDKNKLESIITNLIKNAIKFTKKGYVEIGCEKEGSNLKFYTKDSGEGIPKDKLRAIFNRFVQADNTTTKPYEGSGLGLSIAQAYAKMLGGKIHVKSETGKGSYFEFNISL